MQQNKCSFDFFKHFTFAVIEISKILGNNGNTFAFKILAPGRLNSILFINEPPWLLWNDGEMCVDCWEIKG